MSIKTRNLVILLVILALLVFSVLIIFTKKEPGLKIRVSHDNEVIDVLELESNISKTYEFGEDENILEIKDNKAQVIESNCKNQICVNSPEISEIGETIVCLPHKLIFEVVSE